MENCMALKMKRKELEEINDDFSDFSLSSPARKIRRLDADLPPIFEEEEPGILLGYEQSLLGSDISNSGGGQPKPLVIEELPCVPENEEKAIVLFKPMTNPLVYSPSNLSIDPFLFSSLKNQALWGNHPDTARPSEEDEDGRHVINGEANTCRAVIPWVPSRQLDQRPEILASQTEVSAEAMDVEEMEVATMETEVSDASNTGQQAGDNSNYSRTSEGLQHQWQQQHCLVPQPPQNTTTPIVWYQVT